MLAQIDDPQAVLGEIAADAAEKMLLTSFQARHADVGTRVISLVDDPASPRALFVHGGLACKVYAGAEALGPLVADLLAQRIEQQPPWPDPDLSAAWDEAGRPQLRLVHARESVWRAFVTPSTLEYARSMLSVNRRFLTACVILPFSMRNVPSRVIPVKSAFFVSRSPFR